MKIELNDKYFKSAAALFLLIGAYWYGMMGPLTSQWPGDSIQAGDPVDTLYMIWGLQHTPNFEDTFKWWTGTWVGGVNSIGHKVTYYRPLTSLIWWFQFKAFGMQGLHEFLFIHRVWHALVCAIAVLFLRRVVGWRIAVLGVAIWAAGLADWLTLPTPIDALMNWKDDPDLTISLSVMLALWALLSYWRTGHRKFLVGAVAAQIIGICFKEMAYVGPFLAVLLLWYESRGDKTFIQKHWRDVALFFLILGLAYIYRTWALGGGGFRFGTNGSWFIRAVSHCLGGRAFILPLSGQTAPLGVALWIFIVVAIARRQGRLAAGLGTVSIALIVLADFIAGSMGQTFNRLITPFPWWAQTIYTDALVTFGILVAWGIFLTAKDRRQQFGFGWLLLAYIPLLTAPILGHALYLPSLGWAIWLACILNWLIIKGASLANPINRNNTNPQPTSSINPAPAK